jgi:toxin ParE1/3/4
MAWYLSVEAEEDVITLFIEGTERFGLLQAERYHDDLESAFEFLATHPEAAPLRKELTPNIRMRPFGAHMILYNIDDSCDVYVIRVHHAHEDWLKV